MSKSCNTCTHVKMFEANKKPCSFSKSCVCVNGSEHTSEKQLSDALAWAKGRMYEPKSKK
jgi:hypothetical protein